jgi:hypothetical protein
VEGSSARGTAWVDGPQAVAARAFVESWCCRTGPRLPRSTVSFPPCASGPGGTLGTARRLCLLAPPPLMFPHGGAFACCQETRRQALGGTALGYWDQQPPRPMRCGSGMGFLLVGLAAQSAPRRGNLGSTGVPQGPQGSPRQRWSAVVTQRSAKSPVTPLHLTRWMEESWRPAGVVSGLPCTSRASPLAPGLTSPSPIPGSYTEAQPLRLALRRGPGESCFAGWRGAGRPASKNLVAGVRQQQRLLTLPA